MMTPVRLYGHLGKRFGRGRRMLDVSSPREAVELLSATVPGFRDHILAHSAPGYRIVVGGRDSDLEHLEDPHGHQEIRIVPVLAGAKDEGMMVIIGIALMAVTYGASGAWGAAGSFAAGAQSTIGSIGLAMTLGGLSQMLFKPPTIGPNGPSNNASSNSLFNGSLQTTKQGVPVPVGYGRLEVAGVVVSGQIVTDGSAPSQFPSLGDGTGAWTGNGDSTPWSASISAPVFGNVI
jgi:predicted phage tail protein